MADNNRIGDDFLNRQLLTRLRHLRSAGVEWLPHGPPLEVASAPQKPDDSTGLAAQESLDGPTLEGRPPGPQNARR